MDCNLVHADLEKQWVQLFTSVHGNKMALPLLSSAAADHIHLSMEHKTARTHS